MLKIIPLLFLLALGPVHSASGADSLTNLEPGQGIVAPRYAPGATIVLPDGRRSIIEEILPDGRFRTDIGVILTPEGVIAEGPDAGRAVTILETPAAPEIAEKPQDQANPKVAVPEITTPGTRPVKPEEAPAIAAVPGPEAQAPKKPEEQKPETGKTQGPLTIVELLPMTRLPDVQKKEEPAAKSKKQETPKAPEKKPEARKAPEKKPEQAKKVPEKQKHEPAPKKQPEKKQPEKFKKPSVGQHLRIPPDAAKTGNLDFLEGCWQGTRPEYYSKRTIRECFCFGANGSSGKRRVIDPQGHRRCIGGARARLSGSGTLSITSSGAACDDGERWGSAQMTCRNRGQSAPCSWIFPDAQGGRQSYVIPFVRVESCGR